jgi:hypothetical protein
MHNVQELRLALQGLGWIEGQNVQLAIRYAAGDPERARVVVLAISAEKDGNLRVVYARIGCCQGRPAWRGAQAAVARPYPAVTCHVGVNGGPLCLRANSGRSPLHVTRSMAPDRSWDEQSDLRFQACQSYAIARGL